MKLLAIFLSSAMFLQSLFVLPIPASAAAATFQTTSTAPVNGSIACHKVGVLLLAEGLALINGDDISIQGKVHEEAAAHQLVSGKIVQKVAGQSAGNPPSSGTAFFERGPDLKNLEPQCSEESLDLNDGSKIVGRILELNKDACKIAPRSGKTREVAMSDIAQIHSPRVFKFSLEMNGEPNIVFEPTCHPTVLVGHVHHKKKLIIATTALLLIATAISCGVAIPLGVHHHHQSTPLHFVLANNTPAPPPLPIPHTRFSLPPRTPSQTVPSTSIPKFYLLTPGILRKLPKPPPPPPRRRRGQRG